MNAPDLSPQDRFTYLQQQLALPRPGRTWDNLAGAWCVLSMCALVVIVSLINWTDFLGQQPAIYVLCALAAGLGFILGPQAALFYYAQQLDKNQMTYLMAELTRLDDPRAVGLLLTLPETTTAPGADSLQSCPPPIKQALLQGLPRLQRTDAIHLSMKAQTALHRLLSDQDEELVLAVLLALPHVGTLDALPFVGPLTRERTKAGTLLIGRRDPRILNAASQCYAILAEPLARMQMPATLLRGASAPADTLLRPSLPGAEPASEELLRAHPPQPLS